MTNLHSHSLHHSVIIISEVLENDFSDGGSLYHGMLGLWNFLTLMTVKRVLFLWVLRKLGPSGQESLPVLTQWLMTSTLYKVCGEGCLLRITRALGQLLLPPRELSCSSLSYEHSLTSVQRNPSECEQMWRQDPFSTNTLQIPGLVTCFIRGAGERSQNLIHASKVLSI